MAIFSTIQRVSTLSSRRPIQCVSRRLLSDGRVGRLGLGAHKWSRDPNAYAAVVQTAVEKGEMAVLEAGQEGGDMALANILRDNYKGDKALRVLTRIGYRTIQKGGDGETKNSEETESMKNDLVVEEQKGDEGTDDGSPTQVVIHNLGSDSVSKFLRESPLLSLKAHNGGKVDVVPMIHNPEVHNKDGTNQLRERLTDSFSRLEEAVVSEEIPAFGVVSNGLSLPPDHPLHLDWKNVVLEAASEAAKQVHQSHSNLSILQLPANLLETRGIQVARDIQGFLSRQATAPNSHLPTNLEVYVMRPLTCYPDQGTGTGFGFELVDYLLPVGSDGFRSTHTLGQPPSAYDAARNAALSHFDGTELLEAKQGRELTTQERETLEGCKLLQSLMHDLDMGLQHARSFAAYEDQLLTQVIPTLYGTLEEVDEESSAVLHAFFSAHAFAVRHAIARNTRVLLKEGSGQDVPSYEIPSDMTLQEFALRHLLQEEAISKVIVGLNKPDEVTDALEIERKSST